MKWLVNQLGSVDDIRGSLKGGRHSIKELKEALANELENKNRQSVIKLIETRIKQKEKEEVA